MFKDGKPTGAANDVGSAIPTPTQDEEWAQARERDELFEDILDIEGPMRLAMTAVAGFAQPGIAELDRGLAVLDGRIPEAASLQLRAHANALSAAADANDVTGVRAAQGTIVDMLALLRHGE
ncbi:hypothetical protein [Novosphingobium sp. AP12]|uniref:hypothetical protein n=1 Tax=Novosphingobium sp. AP12 TaxID=1144305 RepID=UPI000271F617|nr:hypothetical protein [Novosphingobium sp. AP12]EJL31177.1 hypothetical protein PMI02_01850 [Novosphingobium sp. AP12]